MSRLTATFAAAALMLIVAGLHADDAPPAEKLTLKQQYVPGDYEQSISTTMEQKTQVMGQEMDVRMQMVQDLTLRVDPPDADGNKTITMRFARFRQKMSMPMGEMAFDSAANPAQDQDPNQGKLFRAMTAAKITMTVASDNKIARVSGMDVMLDGLVKTEPRMAPIVDQMKAAMGDEALKTMMEKSAPTLPERAVAVGEQWDADLSQEVPVIGTMNLKQKARLKAVEETPNGKVAVIEVTGKAESEKEQVTRMGEVELKVRKFTLEQSGDTRVSLDNPMVSSTKMKQTGTFAMAMPGPGGEMDMTMKFSGVTETVVRKAAPATQPDQ